MRSLTLHPASLALGLVLGGIALLSMSQAIVSTSPIRIEYAPHPRDMVQVREGVPYTVPPGRILVPTALGKTNGFGFLPALVVNGQTEATVIANGADSTSSIIQLSPGMSIPAGSVVTVTGGAGDGRAWGYLAPQ